MSPLMERGGQLLINSQFSFDRIVLHVTAYRLVDGAIGLTAALLVLIVFWTNALRRSILKRSHGTPPPFFRCSQIQVATWCALARCDNSDDCLSLLPRGVLGLREIGYGNP